MEITPHDLFALIDHERIAEDVLDTRLYGDEQGRRELIDQEAAMTFNDETILQRIYDSLGMDGSESDAYRASFLSGSLYALVVLDELARQRLGNITEYREEWLSRSTMFFMTADAKNEGASGFDGLMANSYTHNSERCYLARVEQLAESVTKDDLEAEAVIAGFSHSLSAGKACIAKLIHESVERDINSYSFNDTDFDEFQSLDVTGRIQAIQHCFLSYCTTLSIDPENLTDHDANQLLSLMQVDFERLLGIEDGKLIIDGTGCITRMPTDITENQKHDVTVEKLAYDTHVIGTVEGFTIGCAPVDMSYMETDNIEYVNLGTMVMLVLKDAEQVTSGIAEPFESTTRVLVGCAVPGTLFHKATS